MIKLIKKSWLLLLGGLGLGIYIVLKILGLKNKTEVISYRTRLDQKLLNIDLDNTYKIKEIESKSQQKKRLLQEAVKTKDKKERLQKFADILNNNKF